MSCSFDISSPWALHDRVALRAEPFGALAYHFETQRLSFLKSPTLARLVRSLDQFPSAREACEAIGIDGEQGPVRRALETLAHAGMIVRRETP